MKQIIYLQILFFKSRPIQEWDNVILAELPHMTDYLLPRTDNAFIQS